MNCVRQFLIFVVCLIGVGAHAASGFWGIPGEFIDESGTRAALSHWAGEQTVVSMEYSACKFVCSTNWKRLLDIQAEADRQKKPIRFLIVSLDPANDSPAAWRDYMKIRGLTRNNWNFLTGNRVATDRVISALNVKWWYFNEAIIHDFRVVGINAKGRQTGVMEDYGVSVQAFLSALDR